MSATRKAFCPNIWCDSAADLPAAGQFVGQVAWLNSNPLIKRWNGSSWVDVTPTFGSGGSNRYSPDREPTSGLATAYSDSFVGGAQLTWSNVNSGPTSETFAYDYAQMTQNNEARNARGRTAGSGVISSDFSLYTKVNQLSFANFASGGVMFLDGGTWAAPTKLWLFYIVHDTGASYAGRVYLQSRASFSGVSTNGTNTPLGAGVPAVAGASLYMWAKYTAGTKAMACYFSYNGLPNAWIPFPMTCTFNNHPDLARLIDNQGSGQPTSTTHQWWRVFINGVNGASAAQYSGGQCGA